MFNYVITSIFALNGSVELYGGLHPGKNLSDLGYVGDIAILGDNLQTV